MDEVEIYASRGLLKQKWRWRRTHQNGNKLASSSEGYTDYDFCILMAQRCNGKDNVIYKYPGLSHSRPYDSHPGTSVPGSELH